MGMGSLAREGARASADSRERLRWGEKLRDRLTRRKPACQDIECQCVAQSQAAGMSSTIAQMTRGVWQTEDRFARDDSGVLGAGVGACGRQRRRRGRASRSGKGLLGFGWR